MDELLITRIKPGVMFFTENGDVVTADEKGAYYDVYKGWIVHDEYGDDFYEDDIVEVFELGLYDHFQIYDKVQYDYSLDDNSLSPAYFDFQVNNVPKIDLLMVYAELQSDINGDCVVVVEPSGDSKARVLGECDDKKFLEKINLQGLDGNFTGNMKDFLTELEQENPCLCRFISYDTNLDNVIIEAESVGFFRKDNFKDNYDYEEMGEKEHE